MGLEVVQVDASVGGKGDQVSLCASLLGEMDVEAGSGIPADGWRGMDDVNNASGAFFSCTSFLSFVKD